MYSKIPSLTIGFHGCDISINKQVIQNNQRLNPSKNDYDWLGHGVYFWENNFKRAYEFASEKKLRGEIKEIAIIGAIIDLGYCLDFVNSQYIKLLEVGYKFEWQIKVSAWLKNNKCNMTIKTVFWNEVISIIEQNDLNILSERFIDFYELLKSWFDIKPIEFNRMEVNYMFSPEIPKILSKLYIIIDGVEDHFSQIYTVRKSINKEAYGIYIKRREDGATLLYLGVWYTFWEEHGCPLCFGVMIDNQDKGIVRKFSENHRGVTHEYEKFRVVCIDKDILKDENCTEKIINAVKKELDVLS